MKLGKGRLAPRPPSEKGLGGRRFRPAATHWEVCPAASRITRQAATLCQDVREAAARLMQGTPAEAMTVECGGPRVYTYEELLRTITRAANVNRMLVPVPFAAWHALAWVAEVLPGAPVTRNQVELMEIDTVASVGVPGFADLGISPRAMEEVLQSILRPAYKCLRLPRPRSRFPRRG